MIDKNALRLAKDDYLKVLSKKLIALSVFEDLKISSLAIDIRNKDEIKKILKDQKISKEIGVYGIFVDPSKISEIKDALRSFRNRQKITEGPRQRVPCPNENAKALNGCLYIGMSSDRSGLEKRLLQHLIGKAGRETSAMKFNLWLEESSSYHIRVDYISFDKTQADIVRDCEKALWNYYQPAIGEL